jgi:hypothetical protein
MFMDFEEFNVSEKSTCFNCLLSCRSVLNSVHVNLLILKGDG